MKKIIKVFEDILFLAFLLMFSAVFLYGLEGQSDEQVISYKNQIEELTIKKELIYEKDIENNEELLSEIKEINNSISDLEDKLFFSRSVIKIGDMLPIVNLFLITTGIFYYKNFQYRKYQKQIINKADS